MAVTSEYVSRNHREVLIDVLLEKYRLRPFKVRKNVFLTSLMVGNSGWFALRDKHVPHFSSSFFLNFHRGLKFSYRIYMGWKAKQDL